jgi:hypothetical protein
VVAAVAVADGVGADGGASGGAAVAGVAPVGTVAGAVPVGAVARVVPVGAAAGGVIGKPRSTVSQLYELDLAFVELVSIRLWLRLSESTPLVLRSEYIWIDEFRMLGRQL